MIKISDLSKAYSPFGDRVQALAGVTINIPKGSIHGIIGRSGAGKSTFLRCLHLAETPDSGAIIIDDIDLCSLSGLQLREARSKISMVYQHFNLLSSRTVYENVALPLEMARMSQKLIHEKVMPLLEMVELDAYAENYPSELSGGQKQRVAIARAIVSQPSLILCDEATSSLDPQTTVSILNLIKRVAKTYDITILIVTHEMEVIKALCDRVSILNNGKIIEDASVEEIFTKPKTQVAQNLVFSTHAQQLPTQLSAKLQPQSFEGCKSILKICFHNDTVEEHVIADMVKRFDVDLNIFMANIEIIKDKPLGIMILEVDAPLDQFKLAIEFLHGKSVTTEVLGYV